MFTKQLGTTIFLLLYEQKLPPFCLNLIADKIFICDKTVASMCTYKTNLYQ